jgi:acetate kinase
MILVVNAGSSSIKVELFAHDLSSILEGKVTEIGGTARIQLGTRNQPIDAPDHKAGFGAILDTLDALGHPIDSLTAAAHRIVHGGADLTDPVHLNAQTLTQIEQFNTLAPLHNPHNLSAIRALAELMPKLPQYASFDTAFHAGNGPLATTYAIPASERAKGIRRYGFHGLSYASLVENLGAKLPHRLLALHLGNGSSLCAIVDGKSVANSMGYSPLDGLVMGTRPGEVDSMAVLRIAEDCGFDEATRLLNKESGLKGLGGTNDMAALLAADTPQTRFAVDHYCYWAARQAGSAIVAMGGVDAVAFTGGIGENAAPVRDKILAHLSFLGDLPVHVIPADEERQIARDALSLINAGQ